MVALLKSLWRHRSLIGEFIVRDLKARYVGSSMGFFWSVIFPIMNLFVYMFVFRLVLKVRWEDSAESRTALVMLAGILVWAAFAETVSRTTNCLVENSNLIQKVVFPSEILPPYLVSSSIVNMAIGLPVLLLGVVFLDRSESLGIAFQPDQLSVCLVLLPVLALLQAVFTAGLGYLFSTLNLFLRDTYHVVGVLVTVWMFATPIFYPAFMVDKELYREQFPETFEARNMEVTMRDFGWLLDINPMHWLIQCYRDIILNQSWPDWFLMGKFAVVALVLFSLGSWFFMSQKRTFPDLL